MSVLSRFRRRKTPYTAATDEERIARYVYLLNTLPASVIESAHATAFADLPPERRREMFEQLRPFLAESEKDAASDDPSVIARLVRRAEEHRSRRAVHAEDGGSDAATAVATAVQGRRAGSDDPRDAVDSRALLLNAAVMTTVTHQFLFSNAVVLYFTAGAGSLGIASEPAWIGGTYEPASAGFDAGGGAYGGDGGGGLDGGGFGFDGGGFGGGFDGGGGFG